ncbi:hypothetical protein DSO57_1037707 [Entomophthora muscae]|uniref:Uncharacterized protein n=1 Tax=Entomophthora muscae TaxID=34485 RepID=A0ACC2TM02_9FUNG|nr:hypothetical protein DSO57_1037707 [Entomophthora muscae]
MMVRHFLARALCLILVPIMIYTTCFQIHFIVLRNYTEAASSMSPEFQKTLNGNGLLDAKQDVIYGSKIRIGHVATNGGYLHSHDHTYPGGSNQQQITLYPFRDDNNFWIIEKSLENHNETVGNEYIMNQDIVRLRHVSTQRRLHSHNVRPVFSDKDYINEVSGYTWPDSNDNFRLDIMRGDSRNPDSSKRLMAIYTRFRLIHVNTGCALYSRPEKLPDWGFKQQQVFCIRDGMRPRSEWVIETNINDQLEDSPIVTYGQMGFFRKFIEINLRMWSSNSELTSSHPFDSRPSAWPFLKRGISFWGKDHAQVYLLGNPIVWYAGSISVALYFFVQTIICLLEKRSIRTPLQALQTKYHSDVGFLTLAWLLHYLPFFLMKRQLFLHHYLPALYFSILAFTATLDLITRRLRAQLRLGITAFVAILAIWFFIKFSPLVYGLQWSKETCEASKYGRKWDFDCKSVK